MDGMGGPALALAFSLGGLFESPSQTTPYAFPEGSEQNFSEHKIVERCRESLEVIRSSSQDFATAADYCPSSWANSLRNFRSYVVWEDARHILVVGKTATNESLYLSWSKQDSTSTVVDVVRRYLDEAYVKVETPEDLERWERDRAQILGPLVDSEPEGWERRAINSAGNEFPLARASSVNLSREPMLFRIRALKPDLFARQPGNWTLN